MSVLNAIRTYHFEDSLEALVFFGLLAGMFSMLQISHYHKKNTLDNALPTPQITISLTLLDTQEAETTAPRQNTKDRQDSPPMDQMKTELSKAAPVTKPPIPIPIESPSTNIIKSDAQRTSEAAPIQKNIHSSTLIKEILMNSKPDSLTINLDTAQHELSATVFDNRLRDAILSAREKRLQRAKRRSLSKTNVGLDTTTNRHGDVHITASNGCTFRYKEGIDPLSQPWYFVGCKDRNTIDIQHMRKNK